MYSLYAQPKLKLDMTIPESKLTIKVNCIRCFSYFMTM